MLIRRSSPTRNFTVLPNEFLQDERLTWAARGLLAEVLSRPPGWTASADSLSARARQLRPESGNGEGRRAVRAMFAEGKRFGYIVVEKERIPASEKGAGQWRSVLAFYDTPQGGTETGTSVPPAETPKGQVAPGTETGTSETGTSIERTEEKEPGSPKTPATAEAADTSSASHETPAAVAEASAAAPATKTGIRKQVTAKIPKQRKSRPSNQQRDNDWRAQIAAADLNELDGIADDHLHGLAAQRLARYRLGIERGADIPADLWVQWVQLTYFYLLKDVAATDEGHMDSLEYPLDETIQAGKSPFKFDETVWTPAGETAESFGVRMQSTARGMTPEQVGPWAGEFEDFRPQIWYDARQRARDYLKAHRMPLEIETIGVLAMQFVIEHYAKTGKDKWPMESVPPSMRSTFPAQSAPPAWAT